jgi:hypothetical protein
LVAPEGEAIAGGRDGEVVDTITNISNAPPGSNSCANDPMQVLFTYAPLSGSTSDYRFPGTSDTGRSLTIGDGKNPPRSCVTSQNITVGSQFPCKRREQTSGTCTPVIFDLGGVIPPSCVCQ